MNVRLKPEDMELIRRRVEAGEYSDETEMVSRALATQERIRLEKVEALKAAIEVGRKDIAEGRFTDFESKEEFDAFFATL